MQNIEDSKLQHTRFIDRVLAGKMVWGLLSPDNSWATAPSNEDESTLVYLFWSDKAYAKRCAVAEWSEYVPKEIPLEAFIKAWLPGMEKDRHLAGTNWNGDLCGLEVSPKSLLEDFRSRQK